MGKHTQVPTIEWVADKLRVANGVLKVEALSDQVLRVSRSRYDPYVAGIASAGCVEANTISHLVTSDLGVEIIANVPKESYWTGGALRLAQGHNIATGAYGDLLRVIDVQDVRSFQSKETAFVERGLRQHDRILSFERVHDRLYRIIRDGAPELLVAMLNEYELTTDHLRTARDRYGRFAVVAITNPNGRATSVAKKAAESMGVEILNWGPFLGRLNRE